MFLHKLANQAFYCQFEGMTTPAKSSLTREELYKAIWSTPAVRLAKAYGISDVALAKICRKFNIPKPGMGYWRLVELGRKQTIPPLPPPPDKCGEVISIQPHNTNARPLPPELESILAPLRSLEHKIQVAEDFRNAHPLIRHTKVILEDGYAGLGNRLSGSWGKQHLDVNVTKAQQRRALLIMDALVRALEKLGHTIEPNEVGSRGTWVKIGQDKVKILLTEKVNRYERELSPEEKTKSYVFDRYRYEATSLLVFRIDEYYPSGGRKSWSDGKKQRLDDQLNEIVEGIIVTGEALRLQRLEWEEQSRRWQEESRRREEHERKRQEEIGRRTTLEQQAELWHKSQNLYTFIGACSDQIRIMENPENRAAGERWLVWARNHAAQLDPFQTGYLQKAVALTFES